ncbi:M1 family metallopeptidase [Paenibacillus sp. FSL H7-0756]|uniref:M1 family metallopeptidase n=1 Tax=Paenibacillus sp. FSL H7-0756 TaxID=2954738 RepID=UPI0030F50F4B
MYPKIIRSVFQKTLVYSLAVALAACPAGGAVQASAQPAAALTESAARAQAQAQVQYRINARLDEKNMRIQGSETVTYRNDSPDTLGELVFHTYADANRSKATQNSMFEQDNEEIGKDNPQKKPEDFLGDIDIRSITAEGQALSFTNSHQALRVSLQQALKPGETLTLDVNFEVKIPYGMQRLSYYKDIINGAHWFPVMSVYDGEQHAWNTKPYSTSFESDYYDSSDFEVHFNVPEAYQVLMPGHLTTEADLKETGRKVITAVAGNTRELVFFASPNYKVERVTRGGLSVEYYYFDNMPDKSKIVNQYIDTAFKAISFFSEKYGNYPYPEFRIAESYVEGVAVEFSRVIQMGLIRQNSDPAHDYVFVHEIAHQWFHALIGNNFETESFLDEGFADFSMVYFAEKQGDAINGFKSIQMDDLTSIDKPIAATNTEVEDLANPTFYGKGRQALYQLYRMAGEDKFDSFMQEYFKRFEYKNATIQGLLQTIQDTLGAEMRKEMDKILHDPHYVLKPEYQLSGAEIAAIRHEQFKELYQFSLAQVPDLPAETMSRIEHKALQGEPLTIVLSEPLGALANKQQQTLLAQLEGSLRIMSIPYEVISNRQMLKRKLKKELGSSNLIAIGNAKANGLILALKPGIIQKSKAIGFDWKTKMNLKAASGAYVIKHPYNQNRLLLHLFWTGDALSRDAFEPYAKQMLTASNFSSDFYQYYMLDRAGRIVSDQKTGNPLAKVFGEE